MKIFRIEGQEYVADSAEQAYQEHMKGWRRATFRSDGFKPVVPVLVSTEDREATLSVPGEPLVRTAGTVAAGEFPSWEDFSDKIDELADEVLQLRNRKHEILTERNMLVALLARITLAAGGKAGVREHEGEGWDPEWKTLVTIDLPTGQASWHFHDRDAHLAAGLPQYEGAWDGHTTAEKYKRVNACDELDALFSRAGADEHFREQEIRRAAVFYLMKVPTTGWDHLYQAFRHLEKLWDKRGDSDFVIKVYEATKHLTVETNNVPT